MSIKNIIFKQILDIKILLELLNLEILYTKILLEN